MSEGTHEPTLPRDEDLRALVRHETPDHLDGFWEGMAASLRGGTLSPLNRASRRRAWLVPAAAAAAVATVVGGTVALRGVTTEAGPPAVAPAGPASDAVDTPVDNPFDIDDWDDLEPGTEYSFGTDPQPPFRLPALAPGGVSDVSFWVDDAGRHALIVSAATEVQGTDRGDSWVVTVASYATLATLGEDGWVVTNRVTQNVDPACERPRAQLGRPWWYFSEGTVTNGLLSGDRLLSEDRDGDGWSEVIIDATSWCGDDDVSAMVAFMDGPDTYLLRGTVPAGYVQVAPGAYEGQVEVRRPPTPVAEPDRAAWPDEIYREARQVYDESYGEFVPVE